MDDDLYQLNSRVSQKNKALHAEDFDADCWLAAVKMETNDFWMFYFCQNYKVWGLLGLDGSNNDHMVWHK